MVGNHHVIVAIPTHLEVNEGLLVEPETILQHKQDQKEKQTVEQVLVKWKWKGVEDATLMNLSDFQGQFPYFSLKDNIDSQQ